MNANFTELDKHEKLARGIVLQMPQENTQSNTEIEKHKKLLENDIRIILFVLLTTF